MLISVKEIVLSPNSWFLVVKILNLVFYFGMPASIFSMEPPSKFNKEEQDKDTTYDGGNGTFISIFTSTIESDNFRFRHNLTCLQVMLDQYLFMNIVYPFK